MEPIDVAEYLERMLNKWDKCEQCELDGSERKAPSVMMTDSDGSNFEIVVEGF